MPKPVVLDQFDHRLIARARRNNLEPARVTADAIGLSESAVLRRLRRLRSEGVICADVSVIDATRLEPRIQIKVLVQVSTEERVVLDAFNASMNASAEVQGAWDLAGPTDYLLAVSVSSMEAFDAFCLRELIPEKGVRAYQSMIVIREIVSLDPARRPLRAN